MKKQVYILYILLASLVLSCNSGKDNSSSVSPVSVIRLDSLITKADDPDTQRKLAEDSVVAPALSLLATFEADTSSSLIDYIGRINKSSAYTIFGPDVAEVFPTLTNQIKVYGNALHNALELLPDVEFPDTLYTIISPYRQAIILSPERIYVALNHFLGSEYPGYEGFPEGLRRISTPDRMPVAICEAILRSSINDERPSQLTLVGNMFHEGAVMYVLSRLLPQVDPGLILGFTPDEMKWLNANERKLWNEIIARDILFSTDRSIQGRMLDVLQNDYSSFINGAPARAARYIGYKLAEAYIETNPNTSFKKLLSWELSNSDDLLMQISYKP